MKKIFLTYYQHSNIDLLIVGGWGEGQPAGAVLQGADQDPHLPPKAGRGQGRVRREVRPEAAKGGTLISGVYRRKSYGGGGGENV